jgi:putative ABC transport system substrate-binding protein
MCVCNEESGCRISPASVAACYCSHSRGAARENPRIGFLAAATTSAVAARIEVFRHGLRELGYIEGKTLSLNGRLQRENRIASPRSRLSWYVSR